VVTGLGIAGYVAKGVVLGVLGILVIIAAVTHDPAQAGGLDEALKTLTELPFGVVLLGVVAVGLIAYGAFCFARARWPKL
jgi:type IV secretory pathway VirB2 component (pilin)